MGVATAAVVVGAISAYGANQAANARAAGDASAEQAAQSNKDIWANTQVPSIEEQQVILQTPSLMGQYTPEQQQAMQLGASQMTGVKADQNTIDAQNQALAGIGQIAQGGYSDSDKATAREVQRQVSTDAQARQNSILNSMAQRGVLGSGEELAARLAGNQQSVNQMSSAGDTLTANAQARALQALGQQGTLGSSINAQQFNQRSQVAQAQDRINQFNTQNQQNVNNTNVANNNYGQQYNLQQKQAIENQRAANANTQQLHNTGLYQTQFNNDIQKNNGLTGANVALGKAEQNTANNQAQADAGYASAATGAVGTLLKPSGST